MTACTTRASRDSLARHAVPRLGRSLVDLATSAVPYLALSVVSYHLLGVSVLLSLALALPTAGFLLRTFIVFHDCTHGSFLPSRRGNAYVGAVVGFLVLAPFTAGVTTTPCTMRRRGTWSVAASGTCPR